MIILLGVAIGLGIGELFYLLDAWFHVSGGSTPKAIQSVYGLFVVAPLRLDDAFKFGRIISWNSTLVLYYGLNGLIAGIVAKSKIGNKSQKFLYFFAFFGFQIVLLLLLL